MPSGRARVEEVRLDHCALVMGSYVNAYGIVRELRACGVRNICIVDRGAGLARASRYVSASFSAPSVDALSRLLTMLSSRYGVTVVFPTDDSHLVMLAELGTTTPKNVVVPTVVLSLGEVFDKVQQYRIAESVDVPVPPWRLIASESSMPSAEELRLPVVLKPVSRSEGSQAQFRTRLVSTASEWAGVRALIRECESRSLGVLASEVVPGGGDRIWAYCAFKSTSGEVLAEWVGRKLSQYPDDFGVFASGAAERNREVLALGRRLVERLPGSGFFEPEFKFDERDGTYRLMEVNLRSMMWHRAGYIAEVSLHGAQWLEALGLPPRSQVQADGARLVYLKHEVANLISRGGYWQTFRRNVLETPRPQWAVFSWSDPMPALYDMMSLPRVFAYHLLKRLR